MSWLPCVTFVEWHLAHALIQYVEYTITVAVCACLFVERYAIPYSSCVLVWC